MGQVSLILCIRMWRESIKEDDSYGKGEKGEYLNISKQFHVENYHRIVISEETQKRGTSCLGREETGECRKKYMERIENHVIQY